MGIPIKNILLTNLTLKISAFILATVLWYVLSQSRVVYHTISVPVCFYNVAQNINIMAPETIDVTVAGKRQDIRALLGSSCGIHIDATTLHENTNRLSLTENNIFLPHNISMVHCNPTYVEITTNKT